MPAIETSHWPLWKKAIFRFFFIYLALQITPINWLDNVPGVSVVTQYYGTLMDWIVTKANNLVFHVRPVLVPENGSGDTSMGWARLWTYLCLALIGAVIWSVLDRKRSNYTHLNYWLLLFTRYYVILVSLTYAIIKLLGLQMVFPNLHQLATPLGDLLPMRFSWFFIGYSKPYQFFSGAMEFIAALLLLNRRTVSLGVIVATGVFLNVMMLNLCYDIPVKIFSIQMEVTCLFLLANESKRLIDFFILNKPAPIGEAYHFRYTKKWMRVTRIVLKCVIIAVCLVLPFYQDTVQNNTDTAQKQPVKNGVYVVTRYRLNNVDIPASGLDSMRWQDVIFDNGLGSVRSNDTLFRKRYNRGYFNYGLDSAKHMLGFKKNFDDKKFMLEFNYAMPDSDNLTLTGLKGKDSLIVELKRTNRHFQLAERQFHWLSEKNR